MTQPQPEPSDARLDPSAANVAVMQTNYGTIEIALDAERVPVTASHFASLARQGFYDGLTFHRIVPGFVIQGGCPDGTGMGGPGFQVEEKPPADIQYTRGVVAMAKAGMDPAGTSGSQFFIVTGANVGLPPEYAYVGQVSEGDDVVEAIGSVAVDRRSEQPAEPVVITSLTVEER